MAKRYSGTVTITLNYRTEGRDAGRDGVYDYSVSLGGRSVAKGTVKPPAAGFGRGIAYDSPIAYDQTASAALSFAQHDAPHAGIGDAAQGDATGTGWHIARQKPVRRVKANRARRPGRRAPAKANGYQNWGQTPADATAVELHAWSKSDPAMQRQIQALRARLRHAHASPDAVKKAFGPLATAVTKGYQQAYGAFVPPQGTHEALRTLLVRDAARSIGPRRSAAPKRRAAKSTGPRARHR